MRENAPFARNLALSHDPQQQFLYVGGGTDIVVVDRKSMEIVGSIEGGGVVGGGHQIGVDSKGNLYVAATGRGAAEADLQGTGAGGSVSAACVIRERQGGIMFTRLFLACAMGAAMVLTTNEPTGAQVRSLDDVKKEVLRRAGKINPFNHIRPGRRASASSRR